MPPRTVRFSRGKNESLKDARTNDHKCGYTCKERELLKWTKTRKKHIRREDLIANITGTTTLKNKKFHF